MIDFRENIDLMEKMIFNFILVEDDELLKPSEYSSLEQYELFILVKSSYFHNDTLKDIYKIAKKFNSEFNKIPNQKELWQHLNLNGIDISQEEFKASFQFSLLDYNYDLLYKYTKSFILLRNLNSSVIDVLSYLKTTDINPENIDGVTDFVRNEINSKLTIDFTSGDDGLNFKEPKAHIQIAKDSTPSGTVFYDKVLGGGWNPKTLVVFQGRPKVGKSMILANVTNRAFLAGVNVGVATIELADSKYMKRLGSDVLNIPGEEYNGFTDEQALSVVSRKIGELSEDYKNKGKKLGELFVKEFPTGSPTAIDIENYFLRKEQQMGFKFQLIVVDYLNLMRPIKDQGSMYEKVKVISEELRGVAVRNKWCIISATQVKREDVKNFDLGMESVAESFGLIHTVDALFGLMRGPLEKRIKVKLIANRDGGYEESWKYFAMDYEYTRLTEEYGDSSEFYSDDDGVSELEDEVKASYNNLNDVSNTTENDFDPFQSATEPEGETIKKDPVKEDKTTSKSEPTTGGQIDIDYDDLLEGL